MGWAKKYKPFHSKMFPEWNNTGLELVSILTDEESLKTENGDTQNKEEIANEFNTFFCNKDSTAERQHWPQTQGRSYC